MGDVHDLVRQVGREQARGLVRTRIDRLCVEIAAEILADDADSLGITHAGFALTSLPHKATVEPVWRRHGGRLTLLVESGRTANLDYIGIPYGSKARMILLYLQTRALQTNSPEVELGPSMRSWMSAMGLTKTGGATYKLITDQARRISACRLTFLWDADGAEMRQNGAFVDTEISLTTVSSNPAQGSLWQESVRLNPRFFQNLKEHPVPVLEAALRQISSRSMALDVYIWLAYRLHFLRKPAPVSWEAIHAQFGVGFRLPRQLKPTFTEALKLALAVYPEARVEVNESGLLLHPSAPPVPKRLAG